MTRRAALALLALAGGLEQVGCGGNGGASPHASGSPSGASGAAGPGTPSGGGDASAASDAGSGAAPDGGANSDGATADVLATIFASVDPTQLQKRLLELTGGVPVTAGGQTFSITERWSPTGKANFRAYWKQYFGALGMTVSENDATIGSQVSQGGPPGETTAHNVEAVLPGRSADSVVLLAHYDSVGVAGKETQNPAADDAGSGLAVVMEAARILSQYPNRAQTVRFVASDYEEETLAGDQAYVKSLVQQAKSGGFNVTLMVNHDQIGWSCWSENLCAAGAPAKNSAFWVITCSGDASNYTYPNLLQGIGAIATRYSTLQVQSSCNDTDDQVAFWQAGIPALEVDEFSWDANPHYDDTGDDTMAHIDLSYLQQIAQVTITYEAQQIGVMP